MTLPTESANVSGWCLYLIECRDGSYYAGITNDLDARYQAHVNGKGARYTRSHPPLRLIGSRAYDNRAAASRAEWEIKQLPKHRKIDYLSGVEKEAASPPTAE
ncbi:GIY-YIG nuclease family protein [Dyella japonica]|uniref:Endonuclease n=1 Tax=Dyella japonica TaxID=231455 RepID=A0ABV2JRC9_9GAMM